MIEEEYMGSTSKSISKKCAKSFFKTRQGLNTLQSVSARPSEAIVDDNDLGHDYFSHRPIYGASYLYATASVHSDAVYRQLRSSYIVDEDGEAIKVS